MPRAAALSVMISVSCFAAIVWILYDFFVPRQKTEAVVSLDTFSEYEVSGLADSALSVEITAPPTGFAADAVSPFRPSEVRLSVRAASGVPAKTQRYPLRLRGFMKEPPLAILEDAKGETHIKAQGDYVQNARITAIENNSVTIKDSSGTYILTVEEKR